MKIICKNQNKKNMPECEKCGIYCKSAKYLIKHQKTAKYCAKYQDIIFVCRRCNFNTKGIKNIEAHATECTGETVIKNPLAEMVNAKEKAEDEKRLLIIKNTQLETRLKSKDMSIMNLQLRLQFEQMKNKIYSNIIQTQTDINIDDIIKEEEGVIHVFNFENGNIPLVVHEFATQKKESYVIEPPKPKPRRKIRRVKIEEPVTDIVVEQDDDEKKVVKKKTYRTVKEYIKTSEKELGSKLQEYVVRVDKEIDQIVYNNFDVSHKDITESLEKLFDAIISSRVYTVSLSSMQKLRKKLLGKLTLVEYTTLLHEHVKRLNDIFSGRKCTQKKINKIVSSALTPLDMRLAFYSGYTNMNIEIDDVQKFGLALEILTEHQKMFVPYKKQTFFKSIRNYSLSLFELRDCVERCMINRYGFQNVIYLVRPKSTSKDPYAFYTLEKVKEKRCWKMECRMEDFSIDFADNLLPYCVALFRRIYKDVFNDNVYRSDYMEKSQITEFDCEQLIQNIILLGQPMGLCKMFQDVIISKSTFTPTESDKFNLYGDDKFQQKRFSSTRDIDEETCQVIKRLFDGISEEDALHVIVSR
jgi:hypothetical protein